jgi:hypothetical protein
MSTSGTDQQDQTIEQAQAEAMQEIESLIQEIEGIKDSLQEGEGAAPDAVEAAPTLSETPEVSSESELSPEALLEGVDQALQEAEAPTPEAEPSAVVGMDEFKGGSEEPSLEDSVGSIEPEPPAEGGLLADPVVETPAVKPRQTPKGPKSEKPRAVEPNGAEARGSSKKRPSGAPARIGDVARKMDQKMEKRMRASSGGESPEGLLKMTMSGSLRLALVYEAEGRAVTVSFDDGFLRVELTDGSEFRIPLSRGGGSSTRDEDFDEENEDFDSDDLAA